TAPAPATTPAAICMNTRRSAFSGPVSLSSSCILLLLIYEPALQGRGLLMVPSLVGKTSQYPLPPNAELDGETGAALAVSARIAMLITESTTKTAMNFLMTHSPFPSEHAWGSVRRFWSLLLNSIEARPLHTA